MLCRGANAQVALEKFARYFDVEMRLVPVDESTQYCMSPERAMQYVDENTIGVFVILGSTYTGIYEDVVGMSKCLDEYEKKTGQFVPIHVDAYVFVPSFLIDMVLIQRLKRLGWLCRSFRDSSTRLGLQVASRRLDQFELPQVWRMLRRLRHRCVARQAASARRAHLQADLPWCVSFALCDLTYRSIYRLGRVLVLAQLFASCRSDHRHVLQCSSASHFSDVRIY